MISTTRLILLAGEPFHAGAGSFLSQSQNTSIDQWLYSAGTTLVGGNIIHRYRDIADAVISRFSAGSALQPDCHQCVDRFGRHQCHLLVGGRARQVYAHFLGIYQPEQDSIVPIVPANPASGDLRQTTITSFAPPSKRINNLWAGQDRGNRADRFHQQCGHRAS